jgi:hypothetical protein
MAWSVPGDIAGGDSWGDVVGDGPAGGQASTGVGGRFEWIRAQLQPDDLILTWPTWYEDQVVYHLQMLSVAKQLYTHFKQVYADVRRSTN